MTATRTCIAIMAALLCPLSQAGLVINEVCYDNSSLADETGDKTSDWIELYNSGTTNFNVNGYGVGDKNSDNDTYIEANGVLLPNYKIPPGGFLVVFASGDLSEYTAWTNASDIAVIPSNSIWRYYATSGAPDALWKTNGFSDASWATGLSPLGYNDAKLNMDCATVLGYGGNSASRYTAAYFRNAFRVLNPATVTGLVVNARISDGMVLYLNGREVLRYNMPGGTVGYSTLASASVSSELWMSALLATNGLIQGTNIVAVEVHQAAVTSPDLIMDMSLTALVNESVPVVHGSFGLSKEGENVHLFDASSSHTRIQKFVSAAGLVLPGVNQSYGADPDGSTTSFRVFSQPTPGSANSQAMSQMLTSLTVTLSKAPGVYDANQSVTLSTTTGYKIYYSLDGSDPRLSSSSFTSSGAVTVSNRPPVSSGLAWIRTNPVEIGNSENVPTAAWQSPIGSVPQAMILRAVAVSSDGNYCSPETCGTYFVGSAFTNRTLPVVSVSANAEGLFGFTSGICVPGKNYADSPEGYGSNKWGKPHANYHQDNDSENWECPTHFELFETNLTTASASLVLGAAMYGGGTRSLPQKTLYMMARLSEYGNEYLNYKLFPDETATCYKRFLLRNSGNDWYGPDNAGVATMMKDAVFQKIIKGLNLSVMAYRPAVVYINGNYWGVHNFRESYDKHYLATRYNVDSENVDILMHTEDASEEGNIVVTRVDGSKTADDDYVRLIANIDTNGFSPVANYQYIQTQMDVTNYTDYIIAETFFANTDWPVNNCDFWRAHTNQVASCGQYGDTRWRWMLYDLDLAGAEGSGFNMFSYLTSNTMTGKSEPGFLINKLWSCEAYKSFFVTRYANLLNTSFRPERTAQIINQDAQPIASEIENHYRRWGRSYTQAQWAQAVSNTLVRYAADRYTASWTHLNLSFSSVVGGVGDLTVSNRLANGAGGYFTVNGVTIDTATDGVTNRATWTGHYFWNLPVPVTAVPDSGYVFDGWVGTTLTNATRSLVVGVSPITAVARFRLAAAQAYSPTGYEQWQLANYTEQEIIAGTVTGTEAASGLAQISNFALYALGLSRTNDLSTVLARSLLSINSRTQELWVGYTRLNSSFTDVSYTLKVADSLGASVVWRTAVMGEDLEAQAITNALDPSTWHYEVKLPAASSAREARFFKLETTQP